MSLVEQLLHFGIVLKLGGSRHGLPKGPSVGALMHRLVCATKVRGLGFQTLNSKQKKLDTQGWVQ